MRVRAKTVLALPAWQVFKFETGSDALIGFAAPALQIEIVSPDPAPVEWVEGTEVTVRSSVFGLFPQSAHKIHFTTVDVATGVIETEESGGPITRWRHRLVIQPIGERRASYVDEIEIAAGWRTPLYWLAAQAFYRWRQWRWRRLARAFGD